MADPLVEEIAAAVLTALESVTTANGYNYSLANVLRPTRQGGFTPLDLTAVLYQLERVG